MTEPYVRPDVRAFLDMMAANPRPPLDDEIFAQMRQMPSDFLAALDLPVGEIGEIRDVTMPAPHGEIALRLFDPRKERGAGPVMVFYHGGGFIFGSIASHAGLAAEIARRLDLPVISVEYRLAPEHKWPAAPDDAEAAARWIADNGAAFGRRFTGLVLCGDSAGGSLAVVTSLALRDRPAALPVILQMPIYPVVDLSKVYPSRIAFGSGYGTEAVNMDYYGKAYGADPLHWRGSPLLVDQAGMPPTLIATASLDPLRDQGRAYAAAAVQAGVDVVYREFSGTIHGCFSYRRLIPSAQPDLIAFLDLAKAMLAQCDSRSDDG